MARIEPLPVFTPGAVHPPGTTPSYHPIRSIGVDVPVAGHVDINMSDDRWTQVAPGTPCTITTSGRTLNLVVVRRRRNRRRGTIRVWMEQRGGA